MNQESRANNAQLIVEAGGITAAPFPIPGATPGGTSVLVLNLDPEAGPPTFVVRLEPGARIPAHLHRNTAETHYVLDGDFIEDGTPYGRGSFFTHAAGVRHGPHASEGGCSILTVQNAAVDAADFHIVE